MGQAHVYRRPGRCKPLCQQHIRAVRLRRAPQTLLSLNIPVWPDASRRLSGKLPTAPPAIGEAMSAILADVDPVIMPGMTHWNHPSFFAYFNSSGSAPGILGELLAAAFNVNNMLWHSCPSATELEQVTLDWLRQMLGLPPEFFGIIYDGGSSSTFHAIAGLKSLRDHGVETPTLSVRTRYPSPSICAGFRTTSQIS